MGKSDFGAGVAQTAGTGNGRTYCEHLGCLVPIVDPFRAAVLAAAVSAVAFYCKWQALERSLAPIERMTMQLKLNSPMAQIVSLNHTYPAAWLILAVVVALASAIFNGRYARHRSYRSVLFASFAPPGAVLVGMWVCVGIFYRIW